jgi:polyisoprenoid-binding protein YceI
MITRAAAMAAMVALVLAGDAAAEAPASWRVAHGEVRVNCPMTVGGSFEAKTSAMSGTLTLDAPSPAALGGEISVDLKGIVTGIELRDEHLREKYLETAKGSGYDTAVLSDIRLPEADSSVQGRARFTATLLLHGTKQAVAGQADIHRDGNGVKVEATFPLTLSAYGIPAPRYLGVGVKDEVLVKTTLTIAREDASGSSR